VLRWITAGESHGRALVAVVEGMVAGVEVTSTEIADQLARRRLGYGRGARMAFERDAVTLLSGNPPRHHDGRAHRHRDRQHGVAQVGNRDGRRSRRPGGIGRPLRATPRSPGHGRATPTTPACSNTVSTMHVRCLERASARETAARVAAGTVRAGVPASGPRRRGALPRHRDRPVGALRRPAAAGRRPGRDRCQPRSRV